MKSRKEIAKQAKQDIRYSRSQLTSQYAHIRKSQDYYNANIGRNETLVTGYDFAKKKPIANLVQFNDVKPYINYMVGFFAQNRREAKYTAKTNSPVQRAYYSENANALKRYLMASCFSDQIETQQDKDMIMCGIGHKETALTYGQGFSSTNPNGDLEMMRLDPLMTGYDPHSRKPNLTDARYKWYYQEYDKDVALDMFDDSDETDFEGASDNDWNRDTWLTESMDFTDTDKDRVKVYFYQWYEDEKFYRAENPIHTMEPFSAQYHYGKLLELQDKYKDDDDNSLFDFKPEAIELTFSPAMKKDLEKLFPKLESFSYKKKVFYKSIGSGDAVFSSALAESQQAHSIDTKTGDWDASRGIWVGMTAAMMEPALYKAKALYELMFAIASQSKGGVMVETNAVDDVNLFKEEYAKTNSVIEVNNLAGIQPKATPAINSGYEGVIQLADSSIPQSVGLDKSIISGAMGSGMETAQLNRQRIKQSITAFAGYADSITISQYTVARLVLDLMRIYAENNDGSLMRIINDDGAADFVQISKDKLSAEYDITIEEAAQSVDEKEEQGQNLVAMAQLVAPTNPQAMNMLLAKAIKFTGMDRKDQDDIIAILVPQQQEQIDPAVVQQLQQALQEATNQAAQVEIAKKVAETNSTNAKTQQIMANIQLMRPSADLKHAQTVKTLQEAKRTAIETDVAIHYPQQVSV